MFYQEHAPPHFHAEYQGSTTRVGELEDPDVAISNGIRLFGGTEYRVECSSCHDPHVDYTTDTDYDPFLIMPNHGTCLGVNRNDRVAGCGGRVAEVVASREENESEFSIIGGS